MPSHSTTNVRKDNRWNRAARAMNSSYTPSHSVDSTSAPRVRRGLSNISSKKLRAPPDMDPRGGGSSHVYARRSQIHDSNNKRSTSPLLKD